MSKVSELILSILFVALIIFVVGHVTPSTVWYEYESIKPTKAVYKPGEQLKMISTIRTPRPGPKITYLDQFRCLDNGTDNTYKVSKFETALKDKGYGDWYKTAWVWGTVPHTAPKDTPCYIRSVQTVTVLWGIEKISEVSSDTFVVSDFDFTQKQGTKSP